MFEYLYQIVSVFGFSRVSNTDLEVHCPKTRPTMPPTKGDVLRNMETIWSNIALPVMEKCGHERHTDRSRQIYTAFGHYHKRTHTYTLHNYNLHITQCERKVGSRGRNTLRTIEKGRTRGRKRDRK